MRSFRIDFSRQISHKAVCQPLDIPSFFSDRRTPSPHFAPTPVTMVKTRNGTSTIDDAASPLRTPRPHPRSRACLKTNTTDEEGSHAQLRRSTRLVPPRSDSERDSNDDNETLDDNNGPQNDDAHETIPMAAQAPDKSSARKVQTNKSQGGSDINN